MVVIKPLLIPLLWQTYNKVLKPQIEGGGSGWKPEEAIGIQLHNSSGQQIARTALRHKKEVWEGQTLSFLRISHGAQGITSDVHSLLVLYTVLKESYSLKITKPHLHPLPLKPLPMDSPQDVSQGSTTCGWH